MLKWLEQFLSHAMRHRQTAVVDLGGGDTTLRRLVDELPDLAQMATDEGSALAMFYHVGPQVDDLSPVATMEERGFQPDHAAELDQQLGQRVTAAQQRMARAVLIGKLQGDPLADLVEALSQALGVQHEIHRAGVRQQREASAHLEQQLRAAIEAARQPVDPAALVRLEEAAAIGADRRAVKLARAHNWRTVLIAAAVLVGGVVAGAVSGVLMDRRFQLATEAGITTEAFSDGPAASAAWLNLMRSNDIISTLASCAGKTVVVDGRRACGVAIWLDPPPNPAPSTAPTGR
jgi:hypothetical protein